MKVLTHEKNAIGILAGEFGSHPAAWLHPGASLGAEVGFEHYAWVARNAEQGLFDFFFLADTPGIRAGNMHVFKRRTLTAGLSR